MITITLTGDNLADIERQVNALFDKPVASVPLTGTPTPKAEKPAKAEKPKKVEEPEPEEEETEEADSDNPEVSGDDVRAAIATAAKAGHRDAVKETLKKYKAKNVTELDKKHYQSVIDDLELL